ncbi:ficolin-1-like [Drosophila nasuta]|uniref:ficolin-1-like n=1 Tax=Drosophila nasuta TaxID=42062 RepID=UPI00295EF8BD|nr:ficolin-1-like [Drosophila nasuta]
MKFSTHDRNNNKYDRRNCAYNLSNGWWYKDCGVCDFNGLFIGNQHCDFNVKEVKMLIRPKQ